MFQQPSGSDEGGQWRSCFFPARNGYGGDDPITDRRPWGGHPRAGSRENSCRRSYKGEGGGFGRLLRQSVEEGVAVGHGWRFKAKLRARTYGWRGSAVAVTRLKEAL